jgi:hypothetical protein
VRCFKNAALKTKYLDILEETLGVSIPSSVVQYLKICVTCISVLTRIEGMRTSCMETINSFQETSPQKEVDREKRCAVLTPVPLLRKKSCIVPTTPDNSIFDNEDPLPVPSLQSHSEHGYAKPNSVQFEATRAAATSGLYKICSAKKNELHMDDKQLLKSATEEGIPKNIAMSISNCEPVYSAVKDLILLETDSIANKLCSLTMTPGPSILRSKKDVSCLMENDIFGEILLEMRDTMPFVLDILSTLCQSFRSDSSCKITAAMIYGMAMHCRNPQMSAVQRLNTAIALRFHANNEVRYITYYYCGYQAPSS